MRAGLATEAMPLPDLQRHTIPGAPLLTAMESSRFPLALAFRWRAAGPVRKRLGSPSSPRPNLFCAVRRIARRHKTTTLGSLSSAPFCETCSGGSSG